jgi:virulence associated protein
MSGQNNENKPVGMGASICSQNWSRQNYVNLLSEASRNTVVDGEKIKCYILPSEEVCSGDLITDWALHVRRHYIRDGELQRKLQNRGVVAETYLKAYKIPDKKIIRSGDFGEILIGDILEQIESYEVPRYKHWGRQDKNRSDPGSDVIAYRLTESDYWDAADELLVVEVKVLSSSGYIKRVVDDASKDSWKDRVDELEIDKSRLGMTLDYVNSRSLIADDHVTADAMERFQQMAEHPCIIRYGIGAIAAANNPEVLLEKHYQFQSFAQLDLVYIVGGANLADLIDKVYESCIQ